MCLEQNEVQMFSITYQCILKWYIYIYIFFFTIELVFSALVRDNVIRKGKGKYYKPNEKQHCISCYK